MCFNGESVNKDQNVKLKVLIYKGIQPKMKGLQFFWHIR